MKNILSAALTVSLLALGAPASAQENPIQVVPDAPAPAEDSGLEAPDVELDAETVARPADAPMAEPSEAEARSQRAQTIEGAPLGNSNVYVHGVQRKQFTNAGRHELALYPFVAQLNAKFTRHVGIAGTYSYHLFENLALQVTPIFNYLNQESAFNQELIDKGHQQAQAATALLLQYGGVAGVEITPIYGKFAFYEGVLGHFSVVLNAGAGVGSTRIQLANAQEGGRDASFGATGAKFLGSVGAGFRLFIGERAAVRLEVRDLVYTARVDSINGCSRNDLDPSRQGSVSAGCSEGAFASPEDRRLAWQLVRETSSDVLNNISVYTGLSLLF